jgi:hypothetical protein
VFREVYAVDRRARDCGRCRRSAKLRKCQPTVPNPYLDLSLLMKCVPVLVFESARLTSVLILAILAFLRNSPVLADAPVMEVDLGKVKQSITELWRGQPGHRVVVRTLLASSARKIDLEEAVKAIKESNGPLGTFDTCIGPSTYTMRIGNNWWCLGEDDPPKKLPELGEHVMATFGGRTISVAVFEFGPTAYVRSSKHSLNAISPLPIGGSLGHRVGATSLAEIIDRCSDWNRGPSGDLQATGSLSGLDAFTMRLSRRGDGLALRYEFRESVTFPDVNSFRHVGSSESNVDSFDYDGFFEWLLSADYQFTGVHAAYWHTERRLGAPPAVSTHARLVEIEDISPVDAPARISDILCPVPNGTRVTLEDVDGVAFEWKDGEVFRIIDQKTLDEIDQLTFEPSRWRFLYWPSIVALLVALPAIAYRWLKPRE